MPRLSGFLAIALAACASARSTPTPTVTNAKPSTRYALQPIWLHGGMGRHSAFQSWATMTGTLEVAGAHATLWLATRTDTSPILCAGEHVGMQQCAPPGSKFSSSTTTRVLKGDARWDAGTLRVDLASESVKLSLACNDTPLGYACAITGDENFRSPFGDNPARFVFAPLAARTFELLPVQSAGGVEVTGSLTLRADATAQITLTRAAKTVTREASLRWAPAGFVVDAGPALSALMLRCDERGAVVACELSADRSVLGEADHLTSNVTLSLRQ